MLKQVDETVSSGEVGCTAHSVAIFARPEAIEYRAEIDGTTYGRRTARIASTITHHPNGPGCPGECKISFGHLEPNE